jgi:ribulose-5-phosphate 4-epimerase/fuculose-1-phosphate aldolase
MNVHKGQSVAVPSVRDQVSEAEWALRVDLAAAYRLVAAYGWDDLIFTHISARAPDGDHHFLINPYGMLFEEVTASSLVKIDLQGRKIVESPFDVNPAGFTIHSAIHAAREDAVCVMHLHTPAGVAVACQKGGLLPISQQSLFVLASLSYHGYEGVALNEAEKPRLVNDLGESTFLILPNHGLLTVGGSIANAFLAMYTLQRACEIQVLAQSGGGKLIPIHKPVLDGARAQSAQATRGLGGALAWPALLCKADRLDPSYRT